MCNADLKERKRQLFQEMGLPESISFVALAEMLRDTRDKLSEAQDEKELMSLEISAKYRQISDKDRQIQDLIARLSKYEGGIVSELDTTSVENQSKLSEQKITPKIVATSNNSSVPPSKNPIGIRHPQSLRKKSDKKPGGQPGNKGSTYDIPSDGSITNTQRWYPAGDANTHNDCYEGACRT